MVVGFHYTRNVPRYLLRILVVGVVSQPIYAYALNHVPANATSLWTQIAGTRVNIFLTLFLGLLGLWSLREKWCFSQFWGPVAVVALATVFEVDYGWKGVTLLILLYAVRNTRPGIAAVMVSFFLFWGAGYELTRSLFGIPIDLTAVPAWLSAPLKAFMRLETYGLLSLPLILIRFPHDLHMPKWISYSLYPAHLVIILVLKLIIFG
jgi:hypothetical protein